MSIHEFAEPFFRSVNNNNKEADGSILVVTGTFSDMRQVNWIHYKHTLVITV